MNWQTKILIGILVFVCTGDSLNAQDSFSQPYTVAVPEAISISAPGGVVIHHSLTVTDQVFPEQTWTAYTSNTAGAVVTFTISKFQHQAITFFFHNSRLDLRIVDSAPIANWTTVVDNDQTTGGIFAGGDTATVVAESFGAGGADLGLKVQFLQGGLGFVITGSYVATVVGTITNK